MRKVIRGSLILGGIYLIVDGLIHFFNLRLALVTWDSSAIIYGKLLNLIYSSFVFLAVAVVFIIQKDIKKYKDIILITGIWALLHGFLLISLSLTQKYAQVFGQFPSLYVWIPFYDQYLIVEGILLIGYSLIVFYWIKGGSK